MKHNFCPPFYYIIYKQFIYKSSSTNKIIFMSKYFNKRTKIFERIKSTESKTVMGKDWKQKMQSILMNSLA